MRLLKRFLHGTLALAVVCGLVSLVAMRLLTLREVHAAKADYARALAGLERTNRDYGQRRTRLGELTTDTRAVEVEIRSQFLMVKPGERIMLLEYEKPAAPKK